MTFHCLVGEKILRSGGRAKALFALRSIEFLTHSRSQGRTDKSYIVLG
jgi:hypothetical protein